MVSINWVNGQMGRWGRRLVNWAGSGCLASGFAPWSQA
jgi:hypothetical protein